MTDASVNRPRKAGRLASRFVRRGMTLGEVVVAIAITGFLLALVTVVVLRVMRLESRTRNQISQIMTQSRLSDALSDDLHLATNVVVADGRSSDVPALVIALAGGRRVEYSVVDGTIQRLSLRRSEIEVRERFSLPADAAAQWSHESLGAAEIVHLEIANGSGRPLLSLTAQIGRHRPRIPRPKATAADEAPLDK